MSAPQAETGPAENGRPPAGRGRLRRFSLHAAEGAVVALMLLGLFLQVDRYFFKGRLVTKPAAARSEVRGGKRTGAVDGRAEVTAWPPVPGGISNDGRAVAEIVGRYPSRCGGREAIYAFLDKGTVASADRFLAGEIAVDRFPSARIAPIPTWDEDPFGQRYWRFIFYGLRPTRDLLYAYRTTGDEKYVRRLLEVVRSFVTRGIDRPNAWNDCHGAAYRTLVLVNTWWKMRERGALPAPDAMLILQALQRHGEFLESPQHYDHGHNHGITQAAALLTLATAFPDLPGARRWFDTARDRLARSLSDMVDEDGFLVENSSYYHFYAMEKFWEIQAYARRYGIDLGPAYADRLHRMMRFGAALLRPDLGIPVLGASLERRFRMSGLFREMAQESPELRYALSQGREGAPPARRNEVFPASGITVMRSTPEKGAGYANQTHLLFDYGPFRTSHSDLDALGFTLYGQGGELVGDSGLYSYEKSAIRAYFHGTAAHNTVLVDGENQREGNPCAGAFTEGPDWACQTAAHDLYPGVEHARAVMMLGGDLVLVVDRLKSATPHRYELLFHLAPDMAARCSGLDVSAAGTRPERTLSLRPLAREGLALRTVRGSREPFAGFYSGAYEKLEPRTTVVYSRKAASATFVTLLELGAPDRGGQASLSADGQRVRLSRRHRTWEIDLRYTGGKPARVSVEGHALPAVAWNDLRAFADVSAWEAGTPAPGALAADAASGGMALTLRKPVVDVTLSRPLPLDLARNNLYFTFAVEGAASLENAEIFLVSGNGGGKASLSLRSAFLHLDRTGRITVGLGRSRERSWNGSWKMERPGFDWSRVETVGLRFRTAPGGSALIRLLSLSTLPASPRGAVCLIFDDGHWSVLQAARIMAGKGLRGVLGVIADRPRSNTRGYLQLEELRQLKDAYGWDLANHSAHHRNALQDYAAADDLNGFEEDLLDGARYLWENGLDTAPNWFIYPFGAVDAEVEKRVGKYYRFARSVRGLPEVYPFGDPLAVKVFNVKAALSPEKVMAAVDDARRFGLTLLLVFHRLQKESSDPNEYPLDSFQRFVDLLSASGVPVKTLRELDADNGVPPVRRSFFARELSRLEVDIRSGGGKP